MKILLPFLFLLFSFASFAQGPGFDWAIAAGGTNTDYGFAVTTDASGNVITTGQFYGVVDFDPGADVFNLSAQGNGDIFIQKVDANGNLLWAKAVGSFGDDHGYSVTTDAAGNVYATGYFDGAGDFDPGTASYTLASTGNRDIFILKLDANGNFIWAKSAGGVFDDEGRNIQIDGNGDVLICGVFQDIVDFDVTGTIFNSIGTGYKDCFVLKLGSAANFIWVKTFGGTDEDVANAMTLNSTNEIFITGHYGLTTDFNPNNASVYYLTATGYWDVYVLKLTENGDFVWAKSFNGVGTNEGHAIQLDNSENIYVTGYYETSTDFDPSGNDFTLISNGYFDSYVAKLDLNGNFIWAKSMGGTGSDIMRSITVDGDGNIFTSGNYEFGGDFDPAATTYTLTSNGLYDICIVKLDENGSLLWATTLGGFGNDYSPGILSNSDGSLYVVGSYDEVFDADYSSDVFSLTNQGTFDILLIKMNVCLSDTTIDVQTACDTLTWIDGNSYTTNNNTSTHVLTNMNGCDSVILLDLTIIPIDVSVNLSGNTLSVNELIATYQWLNCDSIPTLIPNEYGHNFTTEIDGNFSVVIYKDGCVDTSDCLFVDAPINLANAFSPNGDGINDVFFLEIENASNTVIIYDRWGSVVREFTNYDNISSVWDGTDKNGKLLNGTFYFTIESGQNSSGWVQIVSGN